MTSYIARRLFYAFITFIGITLAVFLLIHAVPGDPVQYYVAAAGPRVVPPEVLAQIRAENHLDQPLWRQYVHWVRGVATLEFGRSLKDRSTVSRRIADKLPNTLLLNLLALSLAVFIAVPLGLVSGARPDRWIDRSSGMLFLILYSLPAFWVALLLTHLFSVKLQLLPLFGMTSNEYVHLSGAQRLADRGLHAILPVVTLAYGQLALYARFSRSAIREVIGREYITVARAKGASDAAVLLRHAFRNAAIPLITLFGLTIPYLISGSVIVERIFQWDGVGRLYLDSILSRDYPVIMALTVLSAVFTLLVNILADVMYAVADPRIRYGDS